MGSPMLDSSERQLNGTAVGVRLPLPSHGSHASVDGPKIQTNEITPFKNMLNLLQIRNFAIIESLDLELGQGFTAITGETGAGKSIMVDALALLMGGRADTGAIRAGCEKAELTAEFELEPQSLALAWLKKTDLADGEQCLLRRLVNANGRSRAWINGTNVTLAQLQELGEHLVEIHGQNEHIRLVKPSEQFRLLDSEAKCARHRDNVRTAFEAWNQIELELQKLDHESSLDAGEQDLLQYQVKELENTVLSATAFKESQAEHELLSRGKDVILSLESARELIEQEGSGIADKLQESIRQLDRHAALDTDINNALSALNEASINCEEARASLQSALSRISLNPERLAELEKSMGRLFDLARKHRVEPIDLEMVLESLRERCEQASTQGERRLALIEQQKILLQNYRSAAKALDQARQTRATKLSTAVSDLMQVLGMEGGRFKLNVIYGPQSQPSHRGDNQLELLVSANPGIEPGPLKKVASGGELSRISLALKVASKVGEPVPTQIFDEVDAGIGGETANSVGRLLQSVASNGQALCVTHLAQVAVCADQQFKVMKNAEENVTQVATNLLNEKERVEEIARMLGGRLSEQSRAHARELLSTALTHH
jgi:DNA repair protein RecN (Recombination protein N)